MSDDFMLTIDRLNCRVNLAAGSAAPGSARDMVERIVHDELVTALKTLDLPVAGDEDAVYRVHDLRLELWFEPQFEAREMIAERWSRVIGAAVIHAIKRGAPNLIVRFDSPLDYLLHFLRDLIDGRAWGCWYYDEFRILRALADEQVALELMIQRPAWIRPLLNALMISGHDERLLARWRAADFARLWAALGLVFVPDFDASLAGGVTQVTVSLSGGLDEDARARDALRLWLALPDQDANTFTVARLLVDLAAIMRHIPEMRGVLLMQSELYAALLRRVEASGAGDMLAWLLPMSTTASGRARLARAAEVVAHRSDIAEPEASLISPAGAVLLLALGIIDLDLWDLWKAAEGEANSRRYLFVLMLKALGRDRAPLHLGDLMLAAFVGLDEPPVADARLPLDLHADAGTPSWMEDLSRLAARYYPQHMWQIAAETALGIEVVRDQHVEMWLAARLATGQPLEDWATDVSPTVLMNETARAKLTAEADHLLADRRLGYPWLTPALDSALAVAASLALRRVAARLPRFEASSPAYLATQFLAQPAQLIVQPDRWIVRLSGGPLRVVLALAPLPQRLSVPWLPLPLSFELPDAGGLG